MDADQRHAQAQHEVRQTSREDAATGWRKKRTRAEGEGEIAEDTMSAGSLKLWNVERGFGFIQDDAGGPDMFLHITALQDAGISPDSLAQGDRFVYETSSTRDGRTKASNVRRA